MLIEKIEKNWIDGRSSKLCENENGFEPIVDVST